MGVHTASVDPHPSEQLSNSIRVVKKYSQWWYRNIYLKSEHWRRYRRIKLAQSPYCADCGRRRATDCHHNFYVDKDGKSVLGFEHNYRNATVNLCRVCHNERHRERQAVAWKRTWWGRLFLWVFDELK